MNVLDQAAEITSGDRHTFYGHPADNHGCTAAFWCEYIKRKYGVYVDLTARDVCMMMILQKVSRDANQNKLDNLVDICGYSRNAEMVEEREHADMAVGPAADVFADPPEAAPGTVDASGSAVHAGAPQARWSRGQDILAGDQRTGNDSRRETDTESSLAVAGDVVRTGGLCSSHGGLSDK